MPYADPAKQKKYLRKYYAERKAKLLREHRDNYQNAIEQRRAKQTARNRAKGFPERPEGRNRSARIPVDRKRRWVIYEDRCYTNSQIGFTRADLKTMLKELQESERTHVLR